MKSKLLAAIAAVSVLGLAGCANVDRPTAGALGGAVIGGAIGHAVGKSTGATIGGAAVGAAVGTQVVRP